MEWKDIKDLKKETEESEPAEEPTEEQAEKIEEKELAEEPAEEQTVEIKEEKAPEIAEEKPAEEKAPETAEEKPAEEKAPKTAGDDRKAARKKSRQKRFRFYGKTVFYALAICAVALIAFFFFGVGIKNTDGPVGYWKITEASSGEVVMHSEDAEAMGLREIGAFKLNRGGDCVITYLGKSANGKWKESKSGKIVIEYAKDKKLVATINEETNVMTAKDDESMVYKLEK